MRVSALFVLAVLASTCGEDLPARPPDIRGQVTRLTNVDGDRVMLVEEEPGEASHGAKILARVDSATSVLLQGVEAVHPSRAGDLMVGYQVSVWIDGPIATSYPAQGKAGTVLILPFGAPRRSASPTRSP